MPIDGVVNAFGQAPADPQFPAIDPRVTVDSSSGATVAEVRPLLASEEPKEGDPNASNNPPANPVDVADASSIPDGTSPEASAESPNEPAEPAEPAEPEVSQEDLTKYTQEVLTTGDLSPESLSALAKQLNTSEDVVKFTVKGMQATAEARTNEVLSAIGGAEVYQEISAWASQALSPEDVSAFNATLTSGSTEDVIKATQAIKAKFTEVNGSPKALQVAVTPPASTVVNPPKPATVPYYAFNSIAEQMQAQSDPRYGVDPVYTQKVYDMAARGNY